MKKLDRNDDIIRRIERIENDLDQLNDLLRPYFIMGRLRTDRMAPISSSDFNENDLIYDRVVTPTYEYILVNNSGSLNWVRIAASTF